MLTKIIIRLSRALGLPEINDQLARTSRRQGVNTTDISLLCKEIQRVKEVMANRSGILNTALLTIEQQCNDVREKIGMSRRLPVTAALNQITGQSVGLDSLKEIYHLVDTSDDKQRVAETAFGKFPANMGETVCASICRPPNIEEQLRNSRNQVAELQANSKRLEKLIEHQGAIMASLMSILGVSYNHIPAKSATKPGLELLKGKQRVAVATDSLYENSK